VGIVSEPAGAGAVGTGADAIVGGVDTSAVGVALSGGGSRAAVFGLGALEAITDTGLHRSLVSVSSVSGGSLANGAIAHRCDLATDPPARIHSAVDDTVRRFADDGFLLGGAAATRGYLRALILAAVLGALATVVALVALIGHWWAVLAVAAVVAVVALVAAIRLFLRRSAVTAAAVDRVLLDDTHPPCNDPAYVGRAVHHVICTTELQSGRPIYLTNRAVYGWLHGGAPAAPTVPLSVVMQASAAVPGAFGPVRLDDRVLGLPNAATDAVVLLDGGVYDNMADEWEYGYAGRTKSWDQLTSVQPKGASFLVIVNGSAAWRALKPLGRATFARELGGLTRSQGVQYDVSTSQRRRALLDRFQDTADPLEGVFVQIDASPFTVVDQFRPWKGARGDRARHADQVLGAAGHTRADWDAATDANSAVATTLAPLGGEVATRLRVHGYILTVVQLYVIHGLGDIDLVAGRHLPGRRT
jgi:predicted acylesterase/phospholipase RssA